MKEIYDLWLVQDREGYWRVGYEISSIYPESRFFNNFMPQKALFETALLFKFLNGKICGVHLDVREKTAIRYADLGEKE